MNSIHAGLAKTDLVRDTSRRVVGGVCAGIARRYDLDPWAVRVLLVLTLVLIPGSQLLAYPLAWILMPSEDAARRALGREASGTALPSPTAADSVQDAVIR